jgi:hypothetical protein
MKGICVILLAFVFGLSLAEYYPGIRLNINNPFLNNTVNTVLPKVYDMVAAMIKPPNGTSFEISKIGFNITFGLTPFFLDLQLKSFTSSKVSSEKNSGRYIIVKRNNAYFFKLRICLP